MVRCSVKGCKSDSGTKMPGLSFHSFPEHDNLRQNWIVATGRTEWTPKPSSKICSRHFEDKMLIKKKKLTLLLPSAVPILETKSCIPSSSSIGLNEETLMEIEKKLSINVPAAPSYVARCDALVGAAERGCEPINVTSSSPKFQTKIPSDPIGEWEPLITEIKSEQDLTEPEADPLRDVKVFETSPVPAPAQLREERDRAALIISQSNKIIKLTKRCRMLKLKLNSFHAVIRRRNKKMEQLEAEVLRLREIINSHDAPTINNNVDTRKSTLQIQTPNKIVRFRTNRRVVVMQCDQEENVPAGIQHTSDIRPDKSVGLQHTSEIRPDKAVGVQHPSDIRPNKTVDLQHTSDVRPTDPVGSQLSSNGPKVGPQLSSNSRPNISLNHASEIPSNAPIVVQRMPGIRPNALTSHIRPKKPIVIKRTSGIRLNSSNGVLHTSGIRPNAPVSLKLTSKIRPSKPIVVKRTSGILLNALKGVKCTSNIRPNAPVGVQPTSEIRPNAPVGVQSTSDIQPNALVGVKRTSDIRPNELVIQIDGQHNTVLQPKLVRLDDKTTG